MSEDEGGEQRYNRHGWPRNDPATEAWTSAANCAIYIDQPGPRRLNTGTEVEPRWTERGEAWKQFYAVDLLTSLDADPALLDDAITELTAQLERERAGDRVGTLALELAQRAKATVVESGAHDDLRAKLLLASEHAQQQQVLGFVLPAEHREKAVAQLAELDGEGGRASPGDPAM